jgi:Cu(I)/Ag(I) efflux system protein CusF
MKTIAALSVVLLLAACSAPQGEAAKRDAAATPSPQVATTETASSASPVADMPAAAVAFASGKVEAVDATAGTVTIAHGPVDALKWPAMTMTFKAGSVDIAGLKSGDQVDFEFTSTGMDGTLTKLTHR